MNRGAEMMEDGSMTLRGLRYTRLAVVALLVAMMTLTVAPISLAQAPGTPRDHRRRPPGESPRTGTAGDRMDHRDDGSGKWGLIGLVGLCGPHACDRTPRPGDTRERVSRP